MISLATSAAAAAGLLFGSFLNVCIARLPQHRSIARPGSHCPRCKTPIQPRDNVPLVSYLLLRGRCRTCRGRISPRYPLVEAALALLWALCFARFAANPAHGLLIAAEAAVFCFLALGLLVMDAETMLLPDAFTLPGTALGLLAAALPGGGLPRALNLAASTPAPLPLVQPLLSCVAGSLGAACCLLLLRGVYRLLRRREGMGLGDVKLAAMIGAWLGITGAALSLVLGILLGGLLAVLLVCFQSAREEAWKGLRVPFGTALAAGALGSLLIGQPVLQWYFHFWR